LADGLKIRQLTTTDSIRSDDVIIIDRLESTTAVTHQIKFDDLKGSVLGDFELSLDDLEGVTIDGAVDGEALVYDTQAGGWINSTVSGVAELNDLLDTSIESPQVDDILVYDGNLWKNDSVNPNEDIIIFDTNPETVTLKVTIGTKTTSNPFYGIGSTRCFYINGVEAPHMIFPPGRRVLFDQSDSSNDVRLVFYSDVSSLYNAFLSAYPYGVETSTEAPGTPGAFTAITFGNQYDDPTNPTRIIDQTPILAYHADKSSGEDYMGNAIANTAKMVERIRVLDLDERITAIEDSLGL